MAVRTTINNGAPYGGVYEAYMQVVQNEDSDPRLVILSDPNNILDGMVSSISGDVEEWEFTWDNGSFVKEAIDNAREVWQTQLGIDRGDPPPSYLPESQLSLLHAEYISNSDEDDPVISFCYIDDAGFAGLMLKATKDGGFYASRAFDWVKFTFIFPDNIPVTE